MLHTLPAYNYLEMSDDATKPRSALFSISWLCAMRHENDVYQDTSFLVMHRYQYKHRYRPYFSGIGSVSVWS